MSTLPDSTTEMPRFDDGMLDLRELGRILVAAISEMYTSGVSTRKIEKVAAKLGVDKMGASQVSCICAVLDEKAATLQNQTFEVLEFPYLWIDATYIKARDDSRVASMAAVTVIRCDTGGIHRFIGSDVADTESYGSWKRFLEGLRARGVHGVACVTSDAHEGLGRAISDCFPGAAWQRCVVHLERNMCSLLRARQQRAMAGKAM